MSNSMSNNTSNNTSNKIEIETLVRNIIKVYDDKEHEMERELLTRKMMRQLYKELGDPNTADYERVVNHLYGVSKMRGYTKMPIVITRDKLRYINGGVDYHIKKPSETKQRIVEEYIKDGWSCVVEAYNVTCDIYVPNKDYDNLCIRFISTRDCSKYEYVLIRED